MFGQGSQTFQRTVRLIEAWSPQKEYGHESKFQKDLKDYLEKSLNEGGGGMNDMLGGGIGGSGPNSEIKREHGKSQADIVIDDTVGIELKRNFSNRQRDKLRGQLNNYADEYPYVIAVACGMDKIDGWRELENKFSGQGFGMDATQFEFIIKHREDFGQSTGSSGGQDGGLGDIFGF